MYVQRFYDRDAAQASYLVGCQASGEALVVDPTRHSGQYLEAAAAESLRITLVTETHIHADFISGARDLARRTGAELLLSAMGGAEWQYDVSDEPRVRLLRDGDQFSVGNIAIDTLHTPGHTPEHLTFVVTDRPAHAGAVGAFTGDFLFVGDVGRPDLLERAVGQAGTMEEAARQLYTSLQRLTVLPEYLQVWPGHGAGSACGKSLGSMPMSTLGYERRTNWALQPDSQQEFVRLVLEGQPEVPVYFAAMKRFNQRGPASLDGISVASLIPEAVRSAAERGTTIIDVREPEEWAAGHVPGARSMPLSALVESLADMPQDRRLVVHCQSGKRSAIAASLLRAQGVRDVAEMAGGFTAWRAAGLPIETGSTSS